jgi:uncharacterized membrane protein YeaQ/YmgE (transglycosylase-associated protein family)
MGILGFLLFGLIVGFLARALMPGRQSMGVVMTMIIGSLGSLLGGFLASFLSHNEPTHIHAAGLVGSIIGAIIVLAIAGATGSRRAHI